MNKTGLKILYTLYLAILVSLVHLCDHMVDEPLHVIRGFDEVWRAVESDGVGHLLEVLFFFVGLAFVIGLSDVRVDSCVVRL
jgi:hypothetical protein